MPGIARTYEFGSESKVPSFRLVAVADSVDVHASVDHDGEQFPTNGQQLVPPARLQVQVLAIAAGLANAFEVSSGCSTAFRRLRHQFHRSPAVDARKSNEGCGPAAIAF